MDEVERVFRQLVDVVADEHPEQLHSPLQASEIYQKFLPYRRFRSALRFDTNQDYEMAILRLLAGAHGYVSIEPVQAQEELKAEVDSVNPNPSAIRDFAAAKVFLNANLVREILSQREAFAPPEPEDTEPDPVAEPESPDYEEPAVKSFGIGPFELDDVQPAAAVIEEPPPPIELEEPIVSSGPNEDLDTAATLEEEYAFPDEEVYEAPVAQTPEDGSATPRGQDNTIDCLGCGKDLPTDRIVVFCPYCGTNQTQTNCPNCGEEMEDAWTFCVSCGARP